MGRQPTEAHMHVSDDWSTAGAIAAGHIGQNIGQYFG